MEAVDFAEAPEELGIILLGTVSMAQGAPSLAVMGMVANAAVGEDQVTSVGAAAAQRGEVVLMLEAAVQRDARSKAKEVST